MSAPTTPTSADGAPVAIKARARNHTLGLDLLLTIGGVEIEYGATVTYYRHKAFDGGRESPSEPARCEVVGITLDYATSRKVALDDLVVAEFEDGLQPLLMEAWADDDAAAAEARADARRDDAMMERAA